MYASCRWARVQCVVDRHVFVRGIGERLGKPYCTVMLRGAFWRGVVRVWICAGVAIVVGVCVWGWGSGWGYLVLCVGRMLCIV